MIGGRPFTGGLEGWAKFFREQTIASGGGLVRAELGSGEEKFGKHGQLKQRAQGAQALVAQKIIPCDENGSGFRLRERLTFRQVRHGAAAGDFGFECGGRFRGSGNKGEAFFAVERGEFHKSGGLPDDIVFYDKQTLGYLDRMGGPPFRIGASPGIKAGVFVCGGRAQKFHGDALVLCGGEPMGGDGRKVGNGGYDNAAKTGGECGFGRLLQAHGIGIGALGTFEDLLIRRVKFAELLPTRGILRAKFRQAGGGRVEGCFGERITNVDESRGDADPIFGCGKFDGGRNEGGEFCTGGVLENFDPGGEAFERACCFGVIRQECFHRELEAGRKHTVGLTC